MTVERLRLRRLKRRASSTGPRTSGCTHCGQSRCRWAGAAERRLGFSGATLLHGERITIRRALHRVDGQLKLESVKTEGSVAVLPLPRPLVPILTNHRRRQLGERLAAGSFRRDTGLVFTTARGGGIEPRNLNRMFHRLCEKANVPQLRVHDLLHSCATLLFTMGVQPATAQRILRHTSITVTTGTCVDVIEAVQRDALDSMESLFASSDIDETG